MEIAETRAAAAPERPGIARAVMADMSTDAGGRPAARSQAAADTRAPQARKTAGERSADARVARAPGAAGKRPAARSRAAPAETSARVAREQAAGGPAVVQRMEATHGRPAVQRLETARGRPVLQRLEAAQGRPSVQRVEAARGRPARTRTPAPDDRGAASHAEAAGQVARAALPEPSFGARLAEATGAVLAREASGVETVSFTPSGAGAPAPAPAARPAAPAAAPPIDVDELYEQIIERLRRDLLAERERMGDLLGIAAVSLPPQPLAARRHRPQHRAGQPHAPDPTGELRFIVEIRDVEIGAFAECSGLAMEYEVLEYQEGGELGFVHKLRGQLKYPNLTLKRGVTHEPALMEWFFARPVARAAADADGLPRRAGRAGGAPLGVRARLPGQVAGPELQRRARRASPPRRSRSPTPASSRDV